MARKTSSIPSESPKVTPDADAAKGQPRKLVAAPIAQKSDGMSWMDDALALWLGILCIWLPRIVEIGIRDLFQLPKQLILAEGAWFAIVLATIMAWAGRPLRLQKTPLLWPWLAFIASICLSVAIAPDYTGGELSIFAKQDLHRWLSASVIFTVTLACVNHPRRLAYIAAGLVVGGLWVSFIGIGEQHNIAWLQPDEKWRIISKPGSTFGNRNMAAELIVAVVPACYALLAMAMRWWTQGKAELALVTAGLTGVALAIQIYYLKLTVTRSAFIGLILGVLVAGVAWILGRVQAERKLDAVERQANQSELGSVVARPSRLLPLLVALGLGGLLVAGTVTFMVGQGLNTPIDEGDQKRGQSVAELAKSTFDYKSQAATWRFGMWASTVKATMAHPLGMGAGNWRVIYPQYVTQREKNEMFTIAKQPIRAHEDFLQIGSEYGVQGLLALLTLIGMAFWLTARVAARYKDPRLSDPDGTAWMAYFAPASLAAIFAILGDAMFCFPLQLPAPTFMFALHMGIIGAVAARMNFAQADAAVATATPVQMPVKIGLTVLAVFICYIIGPVHIAPGDPREKLKNFREMEVEDAKAATTAGHWYSPMPSLNGGWSGLHQRWMVAELGFTDGRELQKRQGRAADGLAAIRRAISLNPDDFQNHFIEGLNLNTMGDTKGAIESIKHSLKLYPNLLNGWVNVAMFAKRMGDEELMNKAMGFALQLKPDELITLNLKANYLIEKGKFAETLALLGPQIGVVPNPIAKSFEHFKPRKLPGYADYRPNFPPDDAQMVTAYVGALKHCADMSKRLKYWPEAAYFNDLLVKEDEHSLDALVGLADALSGMGNWKDALRYYKVSAEMAGSKRGDLKRLYAMAAAHNADWVTAAHEINVTMTVASGEKARLIEQLEEFKAQKPEFAADVDKLLAPLK